MKPKLLIKHLVNEDAMLTFGAQLAVVIKSGTIIFLHGPLGAGKTTLARGFLRGLGFHSKVKSPTYTLVEPYDVAGRKIFHFDFYRLNTPDELQHIGIQEYFSSETICLIEWPEKGHPLLPEADLNCYIAITEQGREVTLEALSVIGEDILKRL
jgi:tRNA threonylcarbamoyladenosine biosynthesis protein TsaE